MVTREVTPRAAGKPAWRLALIIRVSLSETLCRARFGGPHHAQVGYVVTQFSDVFHLLIQVVTRAGVIFHSRKFVQFQ